jgi:hypothetical protein
MRSKLFSLSVFAVIAAGLAGCNARPVSVQDSPAFGEVKAVFVKGRDVQVIEVRALDRMAIQTAALVTADGARVEAESIDTLADPSLLSGARAAQSAPGFVAGSAGAGVAFGAASTTTTLVGQVASVALIRLPELAAYRANWQGARIDVTLGNGPAARSLKLAAPEPAP